MKKSQLLIAVAIAALSGSVAHAAVTADEAKALGTTLTPTGAEKAANKDGSIPAYTGEQIKAPASFKKGDGIRPDPFANEKPILSITAANVGQYANLLTEGTKELLKKYPSFRVDVFPTHRTASFPKAVIDATQKNAVQAKTVSDGLAMEGAHGGVPFPIPKTGYEVMWNHLTRYEGTAYQVKYKSFNVDSSGAPVLAASGEIVQDYPYFNPAMADSGIYYRLKLAYTGPARRAGEVLLVIDPVNPVEKGRRAWQYLPGQRRVKLAPDISYDTPNPGSAGASTYDDAFIFNGKMDRFDFKLIGKKEMIIPYNGYKINYESKAGDVLGPKHINPDVLRWEKHRVWVVEATLKPGARHIYSKRIFYIDEDSWVAVASDQYDARGQLYRSAFQVVTPSYDAQAVYSDLQVFYDFVVGMYNMTGYTSEDGGVKYISSPPDREWTPDAMAGAGIR